MARREVGDGGAKTLGRGQTGGKEREKAEPDARHAVHEGSHF